VVGHHLDTAMKEKKEKEMEEVLEEWEVYRHFGRTNPILPLTYRTASYEMMNSGITAD
jgi:hypothetical protein